MRWFCSCQVGILVTCEDLYTDRQWKICHAFATFVARRTEAGKVRKNGRNMEPSYSSIPWACVRFVCTGTAEASDSSYTNGADGVQPGSGAEEDEAHPCWDHYRPTEQQHSSTGYRQQTQGFSTQHLARWRHHHLKRDRLKPLVFSVLTRRMPGVSGRRASREDTSGERGAGATATCEPPSQHLRGPDHGLDGECGYDCSMVCIHFFCFFCQLV